MVTAVVTFVTPVVGNMMRAQVVNSIYGRFIALLSNFVDMFGDTKLVLACVSWMFTIPWESKGHAPLSRVSSVLDWMGLHRIVLEQSSFGICKKVLEEPTPCPNACSKTPQNKTILVGMNFTGKMPMAMLTHLRFALKLGSYF